MQVNAFDTLGGAGNVAWSLHCAFHEAGHDSWLIVGEKRSNDRSVIEISHDQFRSSWARAWRSVGDEALHRFGRLKGASRVHGALDVIAEPVRTWKRRRDPLGLAFPHSERLLERVPGNVEIIHCHNLHGDYFDIRVLRQLSIKCPVLLTLHDPWMLNGGCVHPRDCEGWISGCGVCPPNTLIPVSRPATRRSWQRKQQAVAGCGLRAAAPSKWLVDQIDRSLLGPSGVESRVIPNGVDLTVFCPGDRSRARAELGLPTDEVLLLSVAAGGSANPWKDYETLEQAAAIVADRLNKTRVTVAVLGGEGVDLHAGRATIKRLGYVFDPVRMAIYYRAADVYVHATRADTHPLAILEALACGTPTIASAVGGIPEQINSLETHPIGANGVLVAENDPELFARAITTLLEDRNLAARIALNAARSAIDRFDVRRQARDYLAWYDEILRQGG